MLHLTHKPLLAKGFFVPLNPLNMNIEAGVASSAVKQRRLPRVVPNIDNQRNFSRLDSQEENLPYSTTNNHHEQALNNLKYKSKEYVGSDAFLEVVMNFTTEIQGIESCWQAFLAHNETENISDLDKVEIFHKLVRDWMMMQVSFFLSENGCDKFLSIQPSYYSQIEAGQGETVVSPTGLRSFGDQAKRYKETNDIVGQGLTTIYEFLSTGRIGDWAVVVSPTEMYQDFNSNTDVINLMAVTGHHNGSPIIEAKYVVIGRVLTQPERRFIHNLCFMQGQNEDTFNKLFIDAKTQSKIIQTDSLLIKDSNAEALSEVEALVARPNTFHFESINSNDPIYDLVTKLNNSHREVFGRPLVNQTDITMYEHIHELVEGNIDDLLNHLIGQPDKNQYYQILRSMIYKSQLEWARINYCNYRDTEWHVDKHIRSLIEGRLMTGFEFGDLFSNNQWGINNPWTSLLLENARFCSQHASYYKETRCPQCSKAKARKEVKARNRELLQPAKLEMRKRKSSQENLAKTQGKKQNSSFFWLALLGLWTAPKKPAKTSRITTGLDMSSRYKQKGGKDTVLYS